MLSLALLDKTQSIAKNLARVLVTAAANELFHDSSLVVGQDNVTGRHLDFSKNYWQIMPIIYLGLSVGLPK